MEVFLRLRKAGETGAREERAGMCNHRFASWSFDTAVGSSCKMKARIG